VLSLDGSVARPPLLWRFESVLAPLTEGEGLLWAGTAPDASLVGSRLGPSAVLCADRGVVVLVAVLVVVDVDLGVGVSALFSCATGASSTSDPASHG